VLDAATSPVRHHHCILPTLARTNAMTAGEFVIHTIVSREVSDGQTEVMSYTWLQVELGRWIAGVFRLWSRKQ
jgi:hypothetical protein